MRRKSMMLILLLATLLLAACGGGASEASQQATAEALLGAIQAQSTTEPPPPPPPDASNAPDKPNAGDGVSAEPDLAATAAADALRLTAEAEQAAIASADVALQATLEPIKAELATYGVDPANGSLAWTHPPITLEVTDFEGFDYANQNLLTVARDFVLTADVTWSSAFAESGCGFAVRSDGKEDEGVSQYIIGMTRGAQGHVLFAEQVLGDVDLNDVTDYFADGIDPKFEWQNGTTNHMAIVGRGQEFTLYSNGTRLGTLQAKAGYEEGFVAFIAINRSGGIRCDFNNGWLWRMDS